MLKSIIKKVPGYRTGVLWKKIIATLFYLSLFLIMIGIPDTATIYDRFLYIMIYLLIFGIPFMLITNLGDIRSRLPLFKKKTLKFNFLGGLLALLIIGVSVSTLGNFRSPEQVRLETLAAQQTAIKNKASKIDSKIKKLGDINQLTLDKESEISTIRQEYESLTSEEKELVTKLVLLESAENKISDLREEKVAENFDDKITALGDVTTLTLDKEADIKAIREEYDTLTSDQKSFVNNLAILESAEKKIADLQANKKVAADLDSRIIALGDVNALTLDKTSSVAAVRTAYTLLTSEEKAFVTKLSVLVSAEKKISDLQTAEKLAAEKAAADQAAVVASTSPTIVSNPTPARNPSNSYTVYITKTGKKYHRDGCRYLSRSQISISKSDAISSGYTPCSVCNS